MRLCTQAERPLCAAHGCLQETGPGELGARVSGASPSQGDRPPLTDRRQTERPLVMHSGKTLDEPRRGGASGRRLHQRIGFTGERSDQTQQVQQGNVALTALDTPQIAA